MNRLLTSAVVAAGLVFPLMVHGLPADRRQPIELEADRAELDESTGIAIYRGRVVLSQGSLRLWADTLTIQTGSGGFVKAVAVGTPARFEQQPKPDSEIVRGEARTVEYEGRDQHLLLVDQAQLEQGRNRFNGHRIEYDLAQDTVTASGGDGTHPGRVRMVITPPEENPGPQSPAEP